MQIPILLQLERCNPHVVNVSLYEMAWQEDRIFHLALSNLPLCKIIAIPSPTVSTEGRF
jgi:hypothetical protein